MPPKALNIFPAKVKDFENLPKIFRSDNSLSSLLKDKQITLQFSIIL
jgi:hypothetical protein